MAQIIPAILTADERDYHDKLLIAEHVSDIIQIDIIDGKFADNTTIGVDIIKKYLTVSMLEVQLMVVNLHEYVSELVKIEHVRRIIVPSEVEGGLTEAIYEIRKCDRQVGLSLNPETPLDKAAGILGQVDMLLLLGVNPGFGGQPFQEIVLEKIRQAKKMSSGLAIEVDGGVNFQTAKKITTAGADFLAANSVLFEASDFRGAYDALSKIANS